MKVLALALIVVLLAIGIVGAVEDAEILQFAKGVMAGSIVDGTIISIHDDLLRGNYSLNEYDSRDPIMNAAHADWVIEALLRVIQEYPTRFSYAQAYVLDGPNVRAATIIVLK